MRKALDIMVLLFMLTALAFGLIGCDGNADQAKADEMLGTDVKLNGTWKSQTVTYTHNGKQYSGQIELRFNDDQMQIVAPYGTSKIHRYTRNGITLNITDPYVSEDNPYRTFPFALEFDSTGFAVDLGALTFMEGVDNIKLKFTKVGDSATIKEPEKGEEKPDVPSNPDVPANPDIPQEPTSLDAFVIEGTTLKGLTDYGKTLGSIVLPDTITAIGNYAFKDCSSLTSIMISDSVTSIESNAFNACSGLVEIIVKKGNNSYVAVDGVLFSKDLHTLVKYPAGKTGEFSIPDSIKKIGDYAFFGCIPLTSITIPSSVTSIGDYAFYWCKGLTSITLPDSITSIGRWAFEYCTGLTNITIPKDVASIGVDAFYGCSGLTEATYAGTIEQWYELGCALGYDRVDVDITCQDGKPVFITERSISNNIEYLSVSGLTPYGKTNCTEVIIPEGVTAIGFGAFWGYTNLTSITIPDGVTEIDDNAFEDCTGLTSITIPNSVTSIGDSAFYGCKGLTSITISNSVTSIGMWTFYGCSGLTSVTIPDGVTEIGYSAFKGCTCLTNVTIPDGVTSIGEEAFRGCKGPTSVTIPDSVTTIGVQAFVCSDLVEFIVKEGNNSYAALEGVLFSKDLHTLVKYPTGKTGEFSIPDSVKKIEDWAFEDCTGLTSITIPSNVTSIGGSAFFYCNSLTDIYVNQPKSTLLDYADVPDGCRIHWNESV